MLTSTPLLRTVSLHTLLLSLLVSGVWYEKADAAAALAKQAEETKEEKPDGDEGEKEEGNSAGALVGEAIGERGAGGARGDGARDDEREARQDEARRWQNERETDETESCRAGKPIGAASATARRVAGAAKLLLEL